MNRPERLEDQIQFLISNLIQREVRDPDLGFLTVTAVKLETFTKTKYAQSKG